MSSLNWYYLYEGKRHGPFTDEELIAIFHRPDAPGPETLVRNDEIDQWIPVSKIEGLTPGPKNLFKLKEKPAWEEPEQPPPAPDLQNMTPCPRCGEPYPPQAVICYRCRKKLTTDANIPWDKIGLNAVRVIVTIFLVWLILHWFEVDMFGSSKPAHKRPPQQPGTSQPGSRQPGGTDTPRDPSSGLSKPSQSIGIDI
jgi:hypothetical protein